MRILTDAELSALRGVCRNPLELSIFEFLRSTGCRVHEMLHVRVEDLKVKESLCYLRKTKGTVRWQKTDTGTRVAIMSMIPRDAFLDDRAVMAIHFYLGSVKLTQKSLLFPRTTRGVREMVYRWSKAAGITHPEQIHPHTFRHTRATRMQAEGVQDSVIKQLLGWSPGSKMFETTYSQLPSDVAANRVKKIMGDKQ